MSADENTGDESGVPMYVAEAVMAILVMTMGAVVMWGSWNLGSGWTTDGPGAGYFPFYISLILIISGGGILVQGLRKRNTELFASNAQMKRVATVLVPALVYVGLIQLVGMYVASAIYITLFMIYIGKYSALKGAVLAVCTSAFFFVLFEVWFKVPLIKGWLNPLGFLGY